MIRLQITATGASKLIYYFFFHFTWFGIKGKSKSPMPHLRYTKSRAEHGCMACKGTFFITELHKWWCVRRVGQDQTSVLLLVQAEGSAPTSPAPTRRLQCRLVHTALFFRVINKSSAKKQIGVTTRFSTPEAGRYDRLLCRSIPAWCWAELWWDSWWDSTH